MLICTRNDIHKARLKTAAGVFDFQPRYIHADAVAHGFTKPATDSSFYIFDAFKTFDGSRYVALNNFGGVYYLGWQEATEVHGVYRSVFNVDVSRDGTTWERKYRFETRQSFQYPAFHEHERSVWLVVTQGDSDASRKERIMFGKLEDSE